MNRRPKKSSRLRRILKTLGWSQAVMADNLGICSHSLYRLEAGLRTPSKTIMLLAEVLLERETTRAAD